MTGKYPVFFEKSLWGELNVSSKGSMLVFEASCSMREGVLRISVYGQGREGYLGVLMPEGDRLCLRKAMSRNMLRDFPREIERVGLSGETTGTESTAQEPDGSSSEEEKHEVCAEEVYWYSSPDGVLVGFDGEQGLVALPVGDERIPANHKGEVKTIEDREYVVYITKDGRIVE